MSPPISRIADKERVAELQQKICCSEDSSVCREDEFCSSDPTKWATLEDGKKVRLLYPPDPKKSSLPGIEYFCSAYTDWYTEHECDAIAKKVQDIVSKEPECKPLSATDKALLIPKILETLPASHSLSLPELMPLASTGTAVQTDAGLPPFVVEPSEAAVATVAQTDAGLPPSMAAPERILGPSETACKLATASDRKMDAIINSRCEGFNSAFLYGLNTFCMKVQKAEKEKSEGGPTTLPEVKSEEGPSSTGLDDFKEKTDTIANYIKIIGLGVAAVAAAAAAGITAIVVSSRELRQATGEFIKEGKGWKPYFDLVWYLIKKPDVTLREDVMLGQLSGLAEKEGFKERGELFNKQEPEVQRYLAELAMDKWDKFSRYRKNLYIKGKTKELMPIGAPDSHLEWFAKTFLVPDKMPALQILALSARGGGSLKTLHTRPEHSIVLGQLRGLKDDPELIKADSKYKVAIEVFGKLDELTSLYVAHKAMDNWGALVKSDVKAATNLVDLGESIAPGTLPHKHVLLFLAKHLKPSNSAALRAAALKWRTDMASKIANEIKPDLENVSALLQRDKEFYTAVKKVTGAKPKIIQVMVRYLSEMAISEWEKLDNGQKATRVMGDVVDFLLGRKHPSYPNGLPWGSRSIFEERVNIGDAQAFAPIYARIIELNPNLKRVLKFDDVNGMAERLLDAWRGASSPVKKALGRAGIGLPDEFIKLMRSSLQLGDGERKGITKAQQPWQYNSEAAKVIYKEVDLHSIMNRLDQRNPELALYPDILESRARALIDAWGSLGHGVKGALRKSCRHKTATRNAVMAEPPPNFVELWLKLNPPEIGVSTRPPIEKPPPKEPPPPDDRDSPPPAVAGGDEPDAVLADELPDALEDSEKAVSLELPLVAANLPAITADGAVAGTPWPRAVFDAVTVDVADVVNPRVTQLATPEGYTFYVLVPEDSIYNTARVNENGAGSQKAKAFSHAGGSGLGAFTTGAIFNVGTGAVAWGAIHYIIEPRIDRELTGPEKLGVYAGTGIGIGAASALASGQSVAWGKLLAGVPVGFASFIPVGSAVAVVESKAGIDPNSPGGELGVIVGGGILAAGAATAELPAFIVTATGVSTAAEAGVTVTGLGLGLGAGILTGGAFLVGYLIGTGIDKGLSWASKEMGPPPWLNPTPISTENHAYFGDGSEMRLLMPYLPISLTGGTYGY